MTELKIAANVERLQEVLDFVNEVLEANSCSMKILTRMAIAVEEIFVNIAYYAYAPGKGDALIRCEIEDDPKAVRITFIDWGVAYDPLSKEDPDTTLSAEDRDIGGLGIFMTKKFMDEMHYERSDGRNILTLYKLI